MIHGLKLLGFRLVKTITAKQQANKQQTNKHFQMGTFDDNDVTIMNIEWNFSGF